MLEEPSSGSNTQTYRPLGELVHMMASSSSSLMSIVHRLLSSRPRVNTSCAMTSSFICCSPCTFVVPPFLPLRFARPSFRTQFWMYLHDVAMLCSRMHRSVSSSFLMCPFAASDGHTSVAVRMKLLRVTNESRSSPISSIECELATRFIAPPIHETRARPGSVSKAPPP